MVAVGLFPEVILSPLDVLAQGAALKLFEAADFVFFFLGRCPHKKVTAVAE